ncbi:MAG: AI-2E family transporter, partial [Planctomycetota bacterium]
MTEDAGRFSPAARLLVLGGSFVLVIAGMRAAASILIPLMLAVFIALLCLPAVRWMQRKKVPEAIGIPVVLGVVLLVGIVVLASLTNSMQSMMGDIP